MKKLTKQERVWIEEYNGLPVNSPKFEKIKQKYVIVKGVEKYEGKDFFYISIIKKIKGNEFETIKTIYLEEFK